MVNNLLMNNFSIGLNECLVLQTCRASPLIRKEVTHRCFLHPAKKNKKEKKEERGERKREARGEFERTAADWWSPAKHALVSDRTRRASLSDDRPPAGSRRLSFPQWLRAHIPGSREAQVSSHATHKRALPHDEEVAEPVYAAISILWPETFRKKDNRTKFHLFSCPERTVGMAKANLARASEIASSNGFFPPLEAARGVKKKFQQI